MKDNNNNKQVPPNISVTALAAVSKFNQENLSTRGYIYSQDILAGLTNVSNDIKRKTLPADDIKVLHPEFEMAMKIVTSSILSPNDMTTSSVSYDIGGIKLPIEVKSSILAILQDAIESKYKLSNKLPNIINEAKYEKGAYIEAVIPEASIDDIIHNRNTTIPGIINTDTMPEGKLIYGNELDTSTVITHGNSNQVNEREQFNYLPNLDKINNKGISKNIDVERVKSNISGSMLYTGLEEDGNGQYSLRHTDGTTDTLGVSSSDLGVNFTDDYTVLSKPASKLRNMSSSNRYRDTIPGLKAILRGRSTGNEDAVALSPFMKQHVPGSIKQMVSVPTMGSATRKSVGAPLVIKLDTESVIPIHSITDEKNHLGYFVLLDGVTSLPITSELDIQAREINNSAFGAGSGTSSGLINRSKLALFGITDQSTKLNDMENIYGDMIHDMLLQSLENSDYEKITKINKDNDLYRVMLFRALRGQRTRVLFLPKELVAYYAFEYRKNGTGKSKIEKLQILYTLKSVLLFSRVMASIKNATNNTKVSATLDEDDADPLGSIELIKELSLINRQNTLPMSFASIPDMSTWLQGLGLSFQFKSDKLPNMEIEAVETSGSKTTPDLAVLDDVSENISIALGVPYDMIKAGFGPDFASTYTSRNLLFSNVIIEDQGILTPQVEHHAKILLYNDQTVIDELVKIIDTNYDKISAMLNSDSASKIKIKEDAQQSLDNDTGDISKDDYILELAITIIDCFKVNLPKPEQNESTALANAYTAYKNTITDVIESTFSSMAFPAELSGELSSRIDTAKSIILNSALREWCVKNNYAGDVVNIVEIDDDGNPKIPLLDSQIIAASDIGKAIIDAFKKAGEVVILSNKINDEINSDSPDATGVTTPEDTNQEDTTVKSPEQDNTEVNETPVDNSSKEDEEEFDPNKDFKF